MRALIEMTLKRDWVIAGVERASERWEAGNTDQLQIFAGMEEFVHSSVR